MSQVYSPVDTEVLPASVTLSRWLRAALGAAEALARLHQSGLIHQNIRPQTLRIDLEAESVELADVHLGKPSARSALKLPPEALPYIAPEQTGRLDGAIDHRADLYSLGLVLYELLAGTLPFHADDPVGWVHCHVARSPRPLAQAAKGTPAPISDIVMRLLAKSPDERYQSARGLVHDLERCLSELSARGHIEPFPLGARDVWDKLRVATRLYGRRAELAVLREALERVRASAGREVALLTGPPGIGKSSLVRELRREVGSASATFLCGKFEHNKRDTPYAALGQAFEDPIRQILALPDAELTAMRERLAAALGDNGQLIIDVIPQVELVLGKQPPAPALPAADTQSRFHVAFRSFLGVFATDERPVVLFLDDLQWADFASLELLQHVMTHPEVRGVFLIAAYRDDEVDGGHPLQAALGEIHSAGVPVASIKLGPLPQEDMVELVVDLFRGDRDAASALAALLWTKANGNPFFAVQILGALHQEQLIRFEPRSWTWRWDIAELEAQQITEDLVELVLGRFRRLPGAALDMLKLAACIGGEFSVSLLGTLCGKSPEEVRRDLDPALSDGLLLHRPEGYKFLHDRVQHAAYSLIPELERAKLHLSLGWLLLERTPDDALDGLLFEIVNQLNLGITHVEGDIERRRIAELNLRAGRKAKGASAARSAATYLSTGVSLLPSGGWETDPALAHDLHVELAECEFLCGRFEEAERLCALVVEHARSPIDQAAAYRIRIQVATAQVDNARAVEVGLTCLRLLGIDLPPRPTRGDVQAEIDWVRRNIGDRKLDDLVSAPASSDPDTIAATEVLSATYPAALYVAPELAQLLVARMVRLGIERGSTPACVHGYVTLGTLLCRSGDVHEGYWFGRLAWQLGQRIGFGGYSAEAAVIFGANIAAWSHPFRETLEFLRIGFRSSRDAGKLIYAASSLLQNVMYLFAAGEPLGAIHEASVLAFDFATGAKFSFLADNAITFQKVVQALRGDTERFGTLSGAGFDEAEFEAHLRERNVPLIRFYHHVYTIAVRYLAHDYAGAQAAAEAAEELLWSGLYSVAEVEHRFFAGLTAAALHDGAAEDERPSLRAKVAAAEEQLRAWADGCQDNFGARHALIEAELARIDGRDHEAAPLYDRAIRASRKVDQVHIEALACELAGSFYLRRSFAILPGACLRDARARYARWGATAKVRQLEALHHDLLAEPGAVSAPPPSPDGNGSGDAEPIDTLTAARASAAISSDMAPDDLLASLMRILIEHAGAQRACLLLPSEDGLRVAAEIASDHEGTHVEIPKVARAPSATSFPVSMALYVRRTREKLIVDDVAARMMFASDAYLASAQPRSMLCAPIIRRGDVAGILYLENRLAGGAFTPRRLALLEFLSAVSLENALLAADLAREAAGRSHAERTLKKSEERLQRLVETANVVPWEADRATGRFTYVGPQVVKMLGYPAAEWLSEGFLSAHVHPHDRESTLAHLGNPAADDDFDFRMIAADGRVVWLHNVVSARGLDGDDVLGGLLFDVTERKEAEATLKEKLDIIEAQQAAIRKLSTPIIEVWDGVLTMPVLGVVDEERAEQMMSVVLDAVSRSACRYMIIDLTGVESVDTTTADHLMKIVRAVQLLGAQSIVVGIRPDVAQTIVSMGIDLSSIVTISNLRGALLRCMRGQRASS